MMQHSQLTMLCRRGMQEMDLLLWAYIEPNTNRGYYQATSAQQKAFLALLQLQDPDLWHLLIGQEQPHDAETRCVLDDIQYCYAQKIEQRKNAN